ncbi:MAG: hypothetical protein SFT94_11960 [Pseudanabaenaceae cyanobacterium bins.68]|nr:hypothetical protein [Pseudanabaenaceae cyanobacterium bins.68]
MKIFSFLTAICTVCLPSLSLCLDLSAQEVVPSSSLYFNQSGRRLIEDRPPVSSDNVTALIAMQQIKTPVQAKVSLYDYEQSLRVAQDAVAQAARSSDTTGVAQILATLNTHELALGFWKECLVAKAEFLCDQNHPVVAEVLRRYPHPVRIEQIARTSPVEALKTVRKPWVNTRIRATLREVVAYVPTVEQKKAIQYLWLQAAKEAELATNALN